MLHGFWPPQVHGPAHNARQAGAEAGADAVALSQQMGSIVTVTIFLLRPDLQGGRNLISVSCDCL